VPEAVVDELEPVEVDAEHREPGAAALERPRELLEEQRAVCQPGQWIEQPCPAFPLEAWVRSRRRAHPAPCIGPLDR
jgi:hypothetical protein